MTWLKNTLKNLSENLVAKSASPLAEEGLIDKDTVKKAVIYNDPEARNQVKKAHNTALAGNLIGAGLMFPPIRKFAKKIITHPITETVGTVTGLYNLTTDQGIEKTINRVKTGEYGKAVLSGLGDILDASPLFGVIKGAKAGYNAFHAGNGVNNAIKMFVDNAPILKFGRMFSKANRAKHAFVTINPFGYEKPFKRGFKWLNSVLSDAPVDPHTFKSNIEEFIPDMSPDWANFYNQNREDAWRIYNGLEQKWGTYIKNADGTYSYNMPEILKRRPNKIINFSAPDGNPFGADNIGGNHGGLTGHTTIDVDDRRAVHYIEDVWDLHPFRRANDKLSSRMANTVLKPVGESLIVTQDVVKGLGDISLIRPGRSKIIRMGIDEKLQKLTNLGKNLHIPKFDTWLSNLEAGKIIGGTPFVMKTRVPTKTVWEVVNGYPVPEIILDDAVDYIIPKEPLQLKFNFGDYPKSFKTIK